MNMVKVIYDGKKPTCRIKVGTMIVNRWAKGDVKDIDDSLVDRLLANKDFKLAKPAVKKKKVTAEKLVIEKVEDEPVELEIDFEINKQEE